MAQLTDFIGTWKAENGPPFSKHTFTWQQLDGHLVGRWILEVPDAATARAAAAAGRPTRAEMQIGEPWLEDGVLFFHVNGGPFISGFRLLGKAEAVVGAALQKLPSEFAGHERLLQRSATGHRVRLTRQM